MGTPVLASVMVELNTEATTGSFQGLAGIVEKAVAGIKPVAIKLDVEGTKKEFSNLSRLVDELTSKMHGAGAAANAMNMAKPDNIQQTVNAYKQLLELQSKIKTYSTAVHKLDPVKNASEYQNALNYLKQYNQQYQELLQKSSKDLSKDQINALTKNFKDLSEVLDKINAQRTDKATQQAAKESQKAAEQELATQNKLYTMLERAQTLRKQAAEGQNGPTNKTTQELDDLITKLQYLKDNFSSTGAEKAAADLDQLGLSLKRITQEGKAAGDFTKSMMDGFTGLENQFVRMFSLTRVMMTAVRQFKEMVKTTVELDSAMTQLRVVTSNTEAEYAQYWKTTSQTAKEIGASITDLVDSTTVFARLGYSLDESSELARLTAMLKNVGDIDVSSAQNALTAITKAFKDVDSSNIETAMDKMVEVGNNFPISVSQLAEGLNNAGSALSASGNSFEQSVALLTAANTTVQNISKSSTGLRTVAARIRKTKTELDDLGETITEATYQKALDMLTGKGVQLTDANGFRSTYDILKDIAAIWDDLSSTSQAAVAEALAGNRQQNVFFSIVEQFQEATKAMDAMQNSTGALSSAYGEYMDSIQAHTDMFKASFQSLSQSLIDSEAAKSITDFGTKALTLFTKLNDVISPLGGLLPIIVGSITGLFAANWGSIAKVSGLTALATGIKNIAAAAKSLKASGGGLTALLSAFKSPAGLGVSIASITAIASMIGQYVQYRKELQAAAVQHAKDSTSSITSDSKSFKEYISNVAELKSAIDGGTLSHDELFEAQSQLLGIQNQLVDAYGNEAKGIDLIASSADGAVTALEQLERKLAVNKANEYLSSNSRDVDKARAKMSAQKHFTADIGYEGMWNMSDRSRGIYSRIQEIIDRYPGATLQTDAYDGTIRLHVDVETKDAKETIMGLANDFRNLGDELQDEGIDLGKAFTAGGSYLDDNGLANLFSDWISNVQSDLDNYSAIYDAYVQNTIQSNQAYYDSYAQATEAHERFVSAMSSQHDTPKARANAIEDALDAYNEAILTIESTNFGNDTEVKSYISGLLSDFDQLNSVVNELKSYGEGGGVDLLARPSIPTKAISTWEEVGEHIGDGFATVFSSTYSNEAGTVAANFTPIITDKDGNFVGYMEPDALAEYASEVIEGVRLDDKHLQIGALFEGDNAVQDATEAADRIHILQEQLYDGITTFGYKTEENIKQSFASIKEYIEETKTAISDLTKATAEAISPTGMTSESVDKVRAMFGELDGFDPDKLFSFTGAGIRMNTDELTKLTDQYVALRKQKIEESLREWNDELEALESQMSKLTKAEKEQEKAKKDVERIDALKNDILQAKAAYAEINALTDAYNRFLAAKSAGDKSDPYANIKNSYDEIKGYFDRGMGYADVVTSYLDLILGKKGEPGGRSGNNEKDFKRLTKKIKGTDYDIMDLFTTDEKNGAKATSEGVDNFVKMLYQLKKNGTIDNGIIKKKGDKYKIDLSGDAWKQISEATGLGYDALMIMGQAMQDAGWKVNFEDIMKSMYGIKDAADEAGKSVQEVTGESGGSGKTGGEDQPKSEVEQAAEDLKGIPDTQTKTVDIVLTGMETVEAFKTWMATSPGTYTLNVDDANSIANVTSNATSLNEMLTGMGEGAYLISINENGINITKTKAENLDTTLQNMQDGSYLVTVDDQGKITAIAGDATGLDEFLKNMGTGSYLVSVNENGISITETKAENLDTTLKNMEKGSYLVHVDDNNEISAIVGDAEGLNNALVAMGEGAYLISVNENGINITKTKAENLETTLQTMEDGSYLVKVNDDGTITSIKGNIDTLTQKADDINNKNPQLKFGTNIATVIEEVNSAAEGIKDIDREVKYKVTFADGSGTEMTFEELEAIRTQNQLENPDIVPPNGIYTPAEESVPEAVAALQGLWEFINDIGDDIGDSLTDEDLYNTSGIDTSVEATVTADTEQVEQAIEDLDGEEIEAEITADTEGIDDAIDDIPDEKEITLEIGGVNGNHNAMDALDIFTADQPEDMQYTMTVSGADEGIDDIEQLAAELGNVEGITTSEVTDNGTAVAVTGNVNGLYAALSSLPTHKTITIDIITNGGVPGLATGTKNAPGGIALVNEEGPEIISDHGTAYIANGGKPALVNLSKGAIVLNADETRAALGSRGMNKSVNAYASGRYGGGKNTPATSSPAWIASGKLTGGNKPSGSGSGGGSGNDKGEEPPPPEKIDWIEVLIDRIERVIDSLADTVASSFKKLTTRLSASVDEVAKIQEEIEYAKQGAERYFKEADSVGLSNALKEKARNGTIDIKEYDKDTADKINEYLKWYEKGLDLQEKVAELHENIAEIYQDRFDMVQEDYENQIEELEHQIEMQEKNVDMVAARGYLESTKFYEAMSNIESKRLSMLKAEMQDLQKYFDEAMASGEIDEGSEAWYEMSQEINDVAEAIAEANVQLVEYEKTMRSIAWDTFDFVIDRFDQLSDEAKFFIDLMSNDELFDDRGQLNDAGMATLGMHSLNFNAFMQKADEYAKQLETINQMIEADPYDTELIERREELLSLQRDSIMAAEDEKNAVQDLISEGIDKELEALKELIDEYKESLDSAKDLYEYQEKLSEKSKDIASIQKQLAAYAGDTSEENRSRVQKLQQDLEKAQKELQEEERDHAIEDQKKLLDDLYDEYEELLNKRLDDVDKLMQDMIDMTNDHMNEIKDKLDAVAEEVGYRITEGMETALDGMFAYYDKVFTGITSISNVLDGIYNAVDAMAEASGALRAYSSGGIVDYTGLAMLHGTPGNPEMVLNPEDTSRFLQMVSAMHSIYDVGDMSSMDVALRDTAGMYGGTTIGSINLGIAIDHVQDYNDFVTQLRDDPKFEKLVQAMTLDQAMGKSRLGKNRINF